MQTLFIDTTEALEDFCQQLAGSEFIALDTEFVRERTYYPQLALIQIANTELIACIDPLAIQDLRPLQALFQDKQICKVLHAASQDLEIFYHLFGELPHPLYDTQIAATLQGLGDQIGYAALVNAMLDVELDKSHSRTDWLQRPLSAKQVSYAEDDVRYLVQLYPIQRQQLEAQQRLAWLEDDFALLSRPERYRPDPANAWKRVKGLNKLRGVSLAILEKVACWREQQAIARDLPRRRVVSDDVLLDIARLRPNNLKALAKLRGISESLVHKHGSTLLQCVVDAEQMPKDQWPKLSRPKRLNDNQEALVDALSAIIKLNAHQYKINVSSLTSRKELENLVRGERDLDVLKGWRLHHGGEQLLAFINGERALNVGDAGLSLTIPIDSH